MSYSEIVKNANGLPLSSRTVEEMLQDYETERLCQQSLERSLKRRSLPRFNSQFVVDILDDLQLTYQQIGQAFLDHAMIIFDTKS